MSSSSIPDQVYYYSKVFQRDEREFRLAEVDQLAVNLYLCNKNFRWFDDIRNYNCDTSMSERPQIDIPFFNNHLKTEISALIAGNLSLLGVPQEEQPIILDKFFDVLQVSRPLRRIVVFIVPVTVSFLGSFQDLDTLDRRMRADPNLHFTMQFGDDGGLSECGSETFQICGLDYHGVNDTVLQESFDALTLRFLPATTSSINSLQKVSLDALEESTVKHCPSCTICMDYFAEAGADQLITPLPCAHIYHSDCIVEWLKTSHQCPVCRYPMPTAEDGEPSNP